MDRQSAETSQDIRDVLRRIVAILDGDPSQDMVGMRVRLRDVETDVRSVLSTLNTERIVARLVELEKLVESIDKERQQYKSLIRGLVIGLGITGTSSLIGLALELAKAFGATP